MATDAWGALQDNPASHGAPVNDQVDDWVAGEHRYVGKRHGVEKLPMGERAPAQEGRDGARQASRN